MGSNRKKEDACIQRQDARQLSPKGAEFYARLLSPMKNCGDEEKFLLTVERLTLQEFLRKARRS